MWIIALLFATLFTVQYGLNQARATWDSGGTVDYVGDFSPTTSTSGSDYFGSDVSTIVIPKTGDFTAEAWVNPDAIDGLDTILHQSNRGSSFDGGFWLGFKTDDKIFVVLGNGGDSTWTLPASAVGSWNHFAVVFEGNTIKLFQNGVEVLNPVISSGGITRQAFPDTLEFPFQIGGNSRDEALAFNGKVDQVKIWNSALTQPQVVKSKDAWGSKYGTTELTGSANNLVAHYDFNEGSGNTLYNRVADSKHLTGVNGPTLSTAAPRLLINPTRSVVINDFSAAVGSATPVTGTLSGASSTADYILRLESNYGDFAVGSNSATKNSGSDTKRLSFTGTNCHSCTKAHCDGST